MKLVKLTTAKAKSTYGDISWITGTTVSIPDDERGIILALPGLLHIYHGDTLTETLVLGLMMDPIHANIGSGVRAFAVAGDLVVSRPDLAGAHKLEVGDEIEVVVPTQDQRLRFAILCAQIAVGDQYPEWNRWAENWLSGEDRSAEAAWEAWAARDAWAAAWEAWEALEAWEAARDAWAVRDAWAAAWAARAAARAADEINLGALALRAIKDERR